MRPMPIRGTSPRAGYEKREYAGSIAALARSRYGAGLEIRCSIGVMTLQLAQRCGTLLAVDIAAAPLTVARRRCAECLQCV